MSQPVRFTHNTRNPRLRYTVAYSFDKTLDGTTLNVTYGIAQCRKGDSFSRAEGRKMAEARLNKARKGKKAAVFDNNGIALVPLYGKLSVQDHEGLSVGKFVSETFEADRKVTLSHNQHSRKAVASDIFEPSLSKALGFGF